MTTRILVAAAVLSGILNVASAFAQEELIPNGDFETIVLDDFGEPVLDEYGNEQAIEWFRAGGGETPPDGTPLTELIGDDSSGTGTRSAAMNPVTGGHADWRSPNFPTTPGELLDFKFDFKFLDVINFPEFQEFRIEVRSFSDQDGSNFVGEQTLYVSPVDYEITGSPVEPADFTDEAWHTLGFMREIPADGYFTDVRVSINAFTTLTEGQVRIDNVSLTRAIEAPPGDYNANGTVDAADFVVWRDTLGSTTDLRANGDDTGLSMGVIDQADYAFWKANFGISAGGSGASLSAVSVPEPATGLLCLAMIALLPARCLRSSSLTIRIT